MIWLAPWWTPMATKRRRPPKPWLKEPIPWWAVAVFGLMLAIVAAMFVWGFFYEGGIP